MKRMPKKRQGFTLVEVVACTVILTFVTLGAVSVSQEISMFKTESRNQIYLSVHNLNVMEQLRQMIYALGEEEELLPYYDTTYFSDSQMNTEVYIEMAELDDYHIYNVRVETSMVDYKQTLNSVCTLTDIGGYRVPSSIEEPDEEGSVTLE